MYSRHRGLAGWLLEEELRRKKNPQIQRKQAASELELERRSILNAMKYRDPERGGAARTHANQSAQPITLALFAANLTDAMSAKSDVIESVST